MVSINTDSPLSSSTAPPPLHQAANTLLLPCQSIELLSVLYHQVKSPLSALSASKSSPSASSVGISPPSTLSTSKSPPSTL